MATTSRLDSRLKTLRLEEEADRATKAQAEQEAVRITTERARLNTLLTRLDTRLAKRSVVKSKLESHAATKSQLKSEIRQLEEDIKKKSETCGDLSDDALLKEFYENTRPLIQALRSQQEDKFKCLHDLVSREPAILDEIDAEDIYLPESTPSEDGNGQADRHEHGAVPATSCLAYVRLQISLLRGNHADSCGNYVYAYCMSASVNLARGQT